jgi:hypothetical protein
VPLPLDPRHARQLDALRAWARLLDNKFALPGTRFRFGLDPLIGLIPVIGDLTTPIFSAAIVLQAFRMGIPKVIQLRMLINVIIDVVIGEFPVLGDLFDFAWKSNAMNMKLLEQHTYEVAHPSSWDYLFVTAVLIGLALCIIVPIGLLLWFINVIGARPF